MIDKEFILKAVSTWRSQDLVEYVLADLESRIKKDKPVKLSVFFTGLSAFTREPLNLFLKGESGVGKTYNTTETLRYFPEESIWFLGGMSRKSLVHSHGTLLNKDGEEIDLDSKPVKPSKKDFEDEQAFREALENYREEIKARREELKDSYTLVDLSSKVLVFLESPDYETFQMLRPILSHDKPEIEYQFVDKTPGGQLQTRRVRLKGWPATIFLTTDNKYIEELATRSFTATPESSELKILEANALTNLKASLPWQYNEETYAFKVVKQLIERIQDQLTESKVDVAIPFLNLYELFPRDISRDMRDFQHFTQFLKTITVLHYFQRPYIKTGETKLLISNLEDVRKALEIYREIFETTRTGTEQKVLKFYHEIVKDLSVRDEDGKVTGTRNGWYLKGLTEAYNQKHVKKLSEESVRLILERLDRIGYVNTQRDDQDKRKNLYVPLMNEEEKDRNLLETGSWLILESKLKNGFETWKKNIPQTTGLYYYKNLAEKPGNWGEDNITMDELSNLVLEGGKLFCSSQQEGVCRIISNEDSNPNLAVVPKIEQERESRRILDNSPEQAESPKVLERYGEHVETSYQCHYCKAEGRPMFFANLKDLRTHINTLHETSDWNYVR